MKETENIPHLDIEITCENIMKGVAKIAEVLRPEWNSDQIKLEERSSGYINRNYRCFVEGDNDSFFLRIVNSRMPGQVDRATNAMRYLKRRQLGAQLLLTFTNGLVMEFIQGKIITWENIDEIRKPEIWLSYAREMAKYHASTNEEDAKEFNIPTHDCIVSIFLAMIKNCLASGKITQEELDGLPTPEQIIDYAEEIYQQLVDAGAETKFCHSDANPTNLLVQADQSVVVVDYDDCFMDLPCMEMAGAFSSLCGVLDFSMDKMPSEEEQDQFLREYLKTRHDLEGKGAVSEKIVEFWKFLLRKAHLSVFLCRIGVVMLLQNVSNRPIDLRIGHTYWNCYKKNRDKILSETFSWD